MPSSDTPVNSGWSHDHEHIAPQGPADWSRETPSDEQFSRPVWKRLRELFERDRREH